MDIVLQCPVCRTPLQLSAKGFQCAQNHSFDASREGYGNLLLSHKKHSKKPNDNKEMIQSRRRFLDLGFYDGISRGINEAAAEVLGRSRNERALHVLDAGCGEGFYLKRLKEHLASDPAPAYYGVDISKFAVRYAARRDRTINWFVASIIDLPFLRSSLDMVLSVFSPIVLPEFERVLTENGALVTVTPGPRHLDGLRKIVYPEAREHTPPSALEEAKGFFPLVRERRVAYAVELTTCGAIMDLLAMTPYRWKIDQKAKARLETIDRLVLNVDVEIRTFGRKQS